MRYDKHVSAVQVNTHAYTHMSTRTSKQRSGCMSKRTCLRICLHTCPNTGQRGSRCLEFPRPASRHLLAKVARQERPSLCRRRRRHVYRAGIGVPVLKMTASARAFQQCAARAYILMADIAMALYSHGFEPGQRASRCLEFSRPASRHLLAKVARQEWPRLHGEHLFLEQLSEHADGGGLYIGHRRRHV